MPRILVVDDNHFNLYAAQIILKDMYSIIAEEAENGQVAVELVSKDLKKECKCLNRVPKLIFMDIEMPILGGIDATKAI